MKCFSGKTRILKDLNILLHSIVDLILYYIKNVICILDYYAIENLFYVNNYLCVLQAIMHHILNAIEIIFTRSLCDNILIV